MTREPLPPSDEFNAGWEEGRHSADVEVGELRAEVERLKAWAEDEQCGRHKAEEDRMNARSEIERLKAALQAITDLCKIGPANPFLADDMDRIARTALEPKP